MDIINLFILFIIKHLVCDFFMQRPYQFLNKGKLGHPGGLLHAAINGFGTMIVLAIGVPDCAFVLALGFGVIEMSAHYTFDLYKVRINSYYEWKPESSQSYWYSLGIDQTLHMLTYVMIIKQLMVGISLDGLYITASATAIISILISTIACILYSKKSLRITHD